MPKTSPKDIAFLNAVQDAIKLRVVGVPYSEVVERVKNADGSNFWKSISACQKAVASALKKEFDQTVEAGRNEIVARNETRVFKLMNKFNKGVSVLVSREITRIDDLTAKLKGYYAPTKIAETDPDGNEKPSKIIVEVVKSARVPEMEPETKDDTQD